MEPEWDIITWVASSGERNKHLDSEAQAKCLDPMDVINTKHIIKSSLLRLIQYTAFT